MKSRGIFITVVVLVCMAGLVEKAAGGQRHETISEKKTGSESFLLYPIHLFRKFVSSADGDRCAMYPSCSTYALHSFKQHGLLMGWIMTCDRLMRCGRDEIHLQPSVIQNGVRLTYDPVSNNDFWWRK